jgi:hypothetical protein
MLSRRRGHAAGDRTARGHAGREDPSRRRVQTAHLPVFVPGARGVRAEDDGDRAGGDGPQGRDRGRVAGRRRACRALRGHPPARNSQHAELRASSGGGTIREAGPAQAGDVFDDRGVAPGGRVRSVAGESRRDPLRARHPHVRDRDPIHARPQRRAAGARAVAPARDRGSFAGHRTLVARAAPRARRCRRRRARPDHRSASDPEPGAVGRRTVARLRELRPVDGRPPKAAGRDGQAARLARHTACPQSRSWASA